MIGTDFLGISLALTSSLIWGAGDFSGGYATRRTHQYQVLALSALSGIVVLVVCAVIWKEPMPTARNALWAGLAGLVGALGLAAFYQALSIGQAARVAPTAAVIGAILPVTFSIFTQGLPGVGRLVGFSLAVAGIWLVSRSSDRASTTGRQSFILACLAGLGFGGFFIFIAQTDHLQVFTPLIFTRGATFLVAAIMLAFRRLPMVSPINHRVATLAGMLDAGGNIFFLLAREYTRLDVAVVLSSLYPAATVILSYLLLKEKISGYQWLGVMLCLAAIGFISA